MPTPLQILFGPVLLYQGRRLRRTLPRLPEPPGDRSGTTGEGPPLRLLIVGDSAAAGVGAGSQREALLGRTASHLAPDFTVSYRLIARTGATTASTLRKLQKEPPALFDVALVSLGVNDLTAGCSLAAWEAEQAALVDLLRERFAVRHVVRSGFPPVHAFPALPQPLRWVLGREARRFDRAVQARAAAAPDQSYVQILTSETATVADMAADGFHPGPAIYRVWGERAAAAIREAHLPASTTRRAA